MPIIRYMLSPGRADYDGIGRATHPVELELCITDKPEGPAIAIAGDVWQYHGSKRHIVLSGQISKYVRNYFPNLSHLCDLWDRWHLNDMRAGCEHQRAEGWDKRPINPRAALDQFAQHIPGYTFTWNMLAWIPPEKHVDGLLGVPCPTCGYKYGTAWLYEPVPADVLAELRATFTTPAP